MRKKPKHNIILLILFCCTCIIGKAQSFRNKAILDSVTASGFYQVILLPAVIAALQPDMRDIRIMDATGKQVPYILKSDLPAFKENKFTAFPILSVKKEADKQTHIIIEKTLQQPIDELLLIIKNTDADRSVTLSGSDDKQNWFIIKEHIYLNSFFSSETDRFVQALVFPKSSYHYFKIIINGKDVLPVNIVKAGVYEEAAHTGKYLPLPAPALVQKDSTDKYSYVFVKFDNFYFIDKLIAEVKGPKFYKRTVEIYTGNIGDAVLPGSFAISSDKEIVLPVNLKTNRLFLKISNNDNPPLQITNITAFQLNKYLLTYLEKAKVYQLLFSDSAAAAPVYDLESYKDSIAGNAATLNYSAIEKNILPGKKPIQKQNDSKAIIWIAIGAAVFILLLLTYKLTAEIKKNPDDHL